MYQQARSGNASPTENITPSAILDLDSLLELIEPMLWTSLTLQTPQIKQDTGV